MKVIALVSFVSRIDGQTYRPAQGDEIDMPKGADWVKAGLAKKKSITKKAKAPESASVETPESAVQPRATKKRDAKKGK